MIDDHEDYGAIQKTFEMYIFHSAIPFLRHDAKAQVCKGIGNISDAEKLGRTQEFIIGMKTPDSETSLEENVGMYFKKKPVI